MGLCFIIFFDHNIDTRMVEKGGDWERRNRLKVYEGTFLLVCREFSDAADLLLDSIATFTCYELFSYRRFVLYTVVATTMTKVSSILNYQIFSSNYSLFSNCP